MKTSFNLEITFGLILLLFSLCASYGQSKTNYQYNVKFVCGDFNGELLAKARYHTAINILNANNSEIKLEYKLSFARLDNNEFVTFNKTLTISPNITKEIDCPEILKHNNTNRAKGYAIIESHVPLTVVGVYSMSDPKIGKSIDIEQYYPTRKPITNCVDLVIVGFTQGNTTSLNYTFKVEVKNIGNLDMPENTQIKLCLMLNNETVDTNLVNSLSSGQSTFITLTIPRASYGSGTELIAFIDCGNKINECNEDNNKMKYVQ